MELKRHMMARVRRCLGPRLRLRYVMRPLVGVMAAGGTTPSASAMHGNVEVLTNQKKGDVGVFASRVTAERTNAG